MAISITLTIFLLIIWLITNYKKKKIENNSFTQFIPWDYLLDDFTIINKNNALQCTFKVKNHDLSFFTEDEIRIKLRQYNRAFKRLPDNFMIHYELQRKKSDGYISKNLENAPNPTKVIDKIRKEEFEKSDYYESEYYITLTYILETGTNDKILELLSTKSDDKEENMERQFEEKYNFFKEKCIEFIEMLKYSTVEIELLRKEELMGYLHSTVNPEFPKTKKMPKIEYGFPLDEYLSKSSFEFGKESKIGDYHLKTYSIIKFPDSIDPLFFKEIEELGFEFRLSTRYIILSEEETKKTILNAWRFHQSKQKNEAQWIFEGITKKPTGSLDEVEVAKTIESREALTEFKEGGINYGYYSFSIILWDKNLKDLEDRIRKINSIVIRHDLEGAEDKYNVKESFVGAIPGNFKQNIRKYTLNTYLLTALMPNSTLYQGEKINKHLKDVPLLTATTRKNDIYYMNLHQGDIGHAVFVGESGMGKSVKIGKSCQEFSKYENSQIFIFDYKGSSKVLTECMGGKYYNLGLDDRLKFQPLATIDTSTGKNFANDWLLKLLEIEKVELTTQITEEVWKGLTTLERFPINRRTLSNYEIVVMNNEIKRAIRKYTISGPYGKYFDGNHDAFSNVKWQVFEMDYAIKDERVVPLIMKFLFYKIETERLKYGYPTLIVVDEAGVLFKNLKEMAKTFDDLLVTIRKLNGSIIFAMQNLFQIKDNPIYESIKGNCKTKVFLPDLAAMNGDRYELYRDIGLNDVEIKELSESEPKKDYILKNDDGTTKYQMTLSPLEVAFVGSTGIKEQIIMDEIVKETNDINEINLKWIEYKFGKNSKEYQLTEQIIMNGA